MSHFCNLRKRNVGDASTSLRTRLLTMLLLLLLLLALTSAAGENPGESANQGSYTGNIGDNINLFDGSLSLSVIDVFLPGRAGLDLMLTRRYNSNIFLRQDVDTNSYSNGSWGPTKPHGYLGDGWDMCLGRFDDVTKTVYYGDGTSEEYFANTGPGRIQFPWRTVSGNRFGGASNTLWLLNGSRYVYGATYNFQGADTVYRGAYLTKIYNAFGDSITISYVDSTFPFISQITDALGRVVYFEYTGSDRWRKLSKIKYYNYNASPDWLEINFSYNGTGQLRKVVSPNGDSTVYDYTNNVLVPGGGSQTLNDSTRILSSVSTTRRGEVSYVYKLFQEQREERIDSSCVHWDTLGGTPICTQWERHAKFKYVNHWSVNQRSAKSTSSDPSEFTTFLHTLDNYRGTVEISAANGGDAVRHRTTVSTPLGETINYYFSINTDVRDWYKSGNLSFYYRDTSSIVVRPGSMYLARSSMQGNGGIWKFLRYHCISFTADNSAPYLVIPITSHDERNGGSDADTRWTPVASCLYFSPNNVAFDTISSTSPYKKVSECGGSRWTSDEITGSVFDTLSSIYRVTKRTLKEYNGSTVDSVVTNYNYSADLKRLNSVVTTQGDKSIRDSLEYDNYGNVTKSYDANGFYTQYIYDDTCHAFVVETKRQVAAGSDKTVGKAAYYWRAGIPQWTEGPTGNRTYYRYDNTNRPTSVKLPLESDSSSCRRYLPASNMIVDSVKMLGGTSATWRVSYTEYDGFNRVIRTRLKLDWNNPNSAFYCDSTTYDTDGRVRKSFRTWNSANRPNPLPFTQYSYDVLGRLVKTKSPISTDSVTVNYLDFYTAETIDESGRRVKTVQDFFGNVVNTFSNYHGGTYSDNSTSTYLPFGKVSSTTPPLGSAYNETYGYDAFGNMNARSNPDEGLKRYYYNKLGQLRLAKDAVGTWTYFKYDGLGRITEQGVVPDADTLQVWSDNTYPSPGTQVVRKKYDTYTDSVATAYRGSALANPTGLLTEVYDPTGYTFFFYDERERVVKKVGYVSGDAVRIHEYTYHPGDVVNRMTYPTYPGASSDYIDYDYYGYGWTRGVNGYTDVGASTPGISYQPFGQVSQLKLGDKSNKVTMNYGYDQAGRLDSEYVSNTFTNNDGAVFRRSYEFTNGDLTRTYKTNSSGAAIRTAQYYSFDYTGRLKTARDSSLSSVRDWEYTYDKNGNLSTMRLGTYTATYDYYSNTNRLSRSGWGMLEDDFEYNNNGCLSFDPTKGGEGTYFLSDYRNLDTLVTQTVYSGQGTSKVDTLRFLYNYAGQRVKKTEITWEYGSPCTFMSEGGNDGDQVEDSEGAESEVGVDGLPGDPCAPRWSRGIKHTYYYYSGSEVSLVLVKYGTSAIDDWTINIYAAGKKIATGNRLSGNPLEKTYEVSDYQGNLRNVFCYDLQNNPQLGQAFWYNPFGKQDSVLICGAMPHLFSYNDKELDKELSLGRYYYGARYYDPVIGRFTSPDPIKDDWTPYSYVRSNPIKYNDPTGMAGVGGETPAGDVDSWPGEPGEDFERTTKDLFNGWYMEDVGKIATASYVNFESEPTGGNTSKKTEDKKEMDISDAGVDFIAKEEAFRSEVYNDAAGNPTIGYGHLIKEGEKFEKITEEEAKELLKADLKVAVEDVNRYLKASVKQNEFDALVSLSFNMGGTRFRKSQTLKYVNAGKFDKAAKKWLTANTAGGKYCKGLANRRKREVNLLQKGVY